MVWFRLRERGFSAINRFCPFMEPDRMQAVLAAIRPLRLLVVGDVMLDRFVWGNVTRISPEAPVPVVEVSRESSYPGGAANVARNLLPFCARVSVAGLVGEDVYGAELTALLRAAGIETEGLLAVAGHQTIVKTRILARSQQVVRIDREKRQAPAPEVQAQILGYLERRLPDVDAIIIEDYGKGFITQELADGLAARAKAAGKLVTVDPNPHNPLLWKNVNVVKPNRYEAFLAAGLSETGPHAPLSTTEALEALGPRLFAKWDTERLLITLSEQGMALLEPGRPPFLVPTRAREVYDVSGAGDTVIALFTAALAAGATPQEAVEISNHAAGVVVGKVGTATLTPQELLAAVERAVE